MKESVNESSHPEEAENELEILVPALEEYKKHLIGVIAGNTDRFEKQLSYISAGSLGISMAFIKDVVGKLNSTVYNWLLLAAWISMGVTLILNLISQVYANNCHSNTIEEIECKKYNSVLVEKRRLKIIWINYISILTMIFGIILLLIFISKNI